MRSLKHARIFKYKRHSKVFEGLDSEANLKALGQFIRELRASKEYIEIHNPKQFNSTTIIRDRNKDPIQRITRTCYSLQWYTRKDKGAKGAE